MKDNELDRIEMTPSMTREYYGDNPDVKPNDNCNWLNEKWFFGWYETDEHLKNRILEAEIAR